MQSKKILRIIIIIIMLAEVERCYLLKWSQKTLAHLHKQFQTVQSLARRLGIFGKVD